MLCLDDQGVIHCKGRLGESSLPEGANKLILLPAKYKYMNLLISEYHKVAHHNWIKETLNALRQTYWIIRGRQAVKKVIRRCVLCLRFERKPFTLSIQPDFPGERLSDGTPFINTRIDFAGPLYAQSNNQQQKVYLCLYTCFNSGSAF